MSPVAKKKSKFNRAPLPDKVCAELLALLKRGFSEPGACGQAGVTIEEFRAQLQADEQLRRDKELAMLAACAGVEQIVLEKLEEGDARIALDYLKRRFPDHWAGRVYNDSGDRQNANDGAETIYQLRVGSNPLSEGDQD